MIEFQDVTKRYGPTLALDRVTFRARPGEVTALLGPTSSGKSAAMRLVAGLDRPASGTVTVDGLDVGRHGVSPGQSGALLDGFDGMRIEGVRSHLRGLADRSGLGRSEVDDAIELAELGEVVHESADALSAGTRQRLRIAAALLGDPGTLVLDEPAAGLDRDGVSWLGSLLRRLAREGRTVLVSSSRQNEVIEAADHLVLLHRGRVVAEGSRTEVLSAAGEPYVLARAEDPSLLIPALLQADASVLLGSAGELVIRGMAAAGVAAVAMAQSLGLGELRTVSPTLEDAFPAGPSSSGQNRDKTPT